MSARPTDEKRALITGAARGIGAAIVRAAVADGYNVWFTDCDIGSGNTLAAGTSAHFVACDMADDRAVVEVVCKVGPVWLLVNNVGIVGPQKPITSISTEEWRQTMNINLTSHFVACREMVPLMRSQGGGCIVNIASVVAQMPYVNRAAYAVSKRGLLALTSTLAWEVGRDGVRVNAILPGLTRGERQETVLKNYAERKAITQEQALEDYLVRQATGRLVEPEEIAAMVVFLAGPQGASITGQFLGVDGGFH